MVHTSFYINTTSGMSSVRPICDIFVLWCPGILPYCVYIIDEKFNVTMIRCLHCIRYIPYGTITFYKVCGQTLRTLGLMTGPIVVSEAGWLLLRVLDDNISYCCGFIVTSFLERHVSQKKSKCCKHWLRISRFISWTLFNGGIEHIQL